MPHNDNKANNIIIAILPVISRSYASHAYHKLLRGQYRPRVLSAVPFSRSCRMPKKFQPHIYWLSSRYQFLTPFDILALPNINWTAPATRSPYPSTMIYRDTRFAATHEHAAYFSKHARPFKMLTMMLRILSLYILLILLMTSQISALKLAEKEPIAHYLNTILILFHAD